VEWAHTHHHLKTYPKEPTSKLGFFQISLKLMIIFFMKFLSLSFWFKVFAIGEGACGNFDNRVKT
jgi:hypothetical protein